MLFSILIVSHNKPDYITEALSSVLAQSYTEWEGLIMDSGTLYDKGHFVSYQREPRLTFYRSEETEHTRNTCAMAPWCFNRLRQLARGELIVYLCDDDLFYPCALESFHLAAKNQAQQVWYASQDIGYIGKEGQEIVIGERRAIALAGKCCNGVPLDCQVDYLQLCHRNIPQIPLWSEGLDTATHADGVFMEAIGERFPIHPIDIKTGRNRRTPISTYAPT